MNLTGDAAFLSYGKVHLRTSGSDTLSPQTDSLKPDGLSGEWIAGVLMKLTLETFMRANQIIMEDAEAVADRFDELRGELDGASPEKRAEIIAEIKVLTMQMGVLIARHSKRLAERRANALETSYVSV